MTDDEKRKEIIEHIKTVYAHPDHVWEQRFLILQAKRATPKELTTMHQIARSKKNDTQR
jgi:hypothetical protein